MSLEGGQTEGNELVLQRACPGKDATQYVVRARIKAARQPVAADGKLHLTECRDALIAIAVATNFNRTSSLPMRTDAWRDEAVADLDGAGSVTAEQLINDAVQDHQGYFQRVSADFGATAQEVHSLPTRERLARIKRGADDDPDLIEMYFQFGATC